MAEFANVDEIAAEIVRLRAALAAVEARAVAAETALAAVKNLHSQDGGQCFQDGFTWPCPTTRALLDVPDQPNPAAATGMPKTDGHVDPNGEPNPSIIGEPELHEACGTRHYWAITPCPPESGQ